MSLTAACTTSLETNRIRSMPSMRTPYWLFVVLILLLGGLQYRLWVGEGSLAQVSGLNEQIAEQQGENQRLLERNRILEAEVMELKQGMETVEERARHAAPEPELCHVAHRERVNALPRPCADTQELDGLVEALRVGWCGRDPPVHVAVA